ncbi:ABC transporter permease [Pseudomonas gingeri NCPPB 3146 = LMG 5327]|uniref:ABC transporter permease n=3 Tax=Pseudomonas gingeri TaxID=117681 RepID=A0A7Y7Y5K7_9PSED|nr:ABC transporter permease [Pseudomonas gingeri]NWC18270.1 ABC transporter permease [Pseudomonas gingeri]NWE46236.1 ABC transporter permease [Pseudomonas gingeri]PNQ90404.1 ABC transporter permease [Pseudomonas gingeri NCPPB 3146 = LMG 5327]
MIASRFPGRHWLVGYVALYLVFLYLPTLLIPIFSFNDSIAPVFPLKGFTLQWYQGLIDNPRLSDAALNSLWVATFAAAIATAAGCLIAYADLRRSTPLARGISLLARLPILLPGVVLGIALLVGVNLIGPGPSLGSIIVGHVCFCLPTTVVVMRSRFAAFPRSLEEAAMDLGADEWTTFVRVALPLALPGLLSSFMLAFITSFDEFIVAFFLVGTEPTLPIYIWSQLRFPKQLPSVMALGTVILVTSVILAALAESIRRRGTRPSATTTMK